MKPNAGKIDRIIRFIVGAAFFYLGLVGNPIWYVFSSAVLVTAFTGWCPLYTIFKFNTLEKSK